MDTEGYLVKRVNHDGDVYYKRPRASVFFKTLKGALRRAAQYQTVYPEIAHEFSVVSARVVEVLDEG